MEKDFNIFGDKKFSDLSQEIYENTKLKKTQIDLLIQEVHSYIQGIEDIAIVGPILKELFDVGVKNDDNLLKLATVIQRIMNKQLDSLIGRNESIRMTKKYGSVEGYKLINSVLDRISKENQI